MQGPIPSLAETRLPIMPETGRALRQLLGRRTTDNRQLQAVLLGDPAAAIALFRTLGQTRQGTGEPVRDAAHALSLIGMEPFRRILGAIPEMTAVHTDGAETGPVTAYSHAAHAAFYAGSLADAKGIDGHGEVATAALLQNPAMLGLWALQPESARRASHAVRDGVALDVAFGAELGEPLRDANCRLAEAWGLPRLARQAMGEVGAVNNRSRTVVLAESMAQTTTAGWQHEATDAVSDELSDFLDLSHDQACAWLHQQAIEAARALRHLDYPLPGFELMFMPGEVADDDADDSDVPVMGGARPQEPGPARPVPDLHTTMAGIMRRIRDEAGASRVVFAMLNRDHSRLRVRLALGGRRDDSLRRLDIDLRERTLFAALMHKTQSAWLHRRHAERYRDHLPASLLQMLGSQDAYLMSLFVRDRPLGLLYGDGSGLDEAGYRRFRDLCNLASEALGAGSQVEPDAQD